MLSAKEDRLANQVKRRFEFFKWNLKSRSASLSLRDDFFAIDDIHDGIHFRVYPAKRQVTVPAKTGLSAAAMQHLLLDLLLPRLLASDGLLVLHGALISCASCGIGFIADSGFGKSTLAASFHSQDSCLLGDDALIVRLDDRGWLGQALYPSLRLFPDSINHLFPSVQETDPVADYTDKRRVPFGVDADSVRLSGLFRLVEPSRQIRVTRLSSASACMAVIANAFALNPNDVKETGRRFSQASELARAIPIFDLAYPRDYTCLSDVQAAVLKALATVTEKP